MEISQEELFEVVRAAEARGKRDYLDSRKSFVDKWTDGTISGTVCKIKPWYQEQPKCKNIPDNLRVILFTDSTHQYAGVVDFIYGERLPEKGRTFTGAIILGELSKTQSEMVNLCVSHNGFIINNR